MSDMSVHGKARQLGPVSLSELRASLADVRALANEMRLSRVMACGMAGLCDMDVDPKLSRTVSALMSCTAGGIR